MGFLRRTIVDGQTNSVSCYELTLMAGVFYPVSDFLGQAKSNHYFPIDRNL